MWDELCLCDICIYPCSRVLGMLYNDACQYMLVRLHLGTVYYSSNRIHICSKLLEVFDHLQFWELHDDAFNSISIKRIYNARS
jgi:hypothetical protein